MSKRIRERRDARDASQADAGNVLGISDAEFGKIERGENRISAERLYRLAEFLQADLYYFFKPIVASKSNPGFQEEEATWTPKIGTSAFMERVAESLRKAPEHLRPELLKAIDELIQKISQRDGNNAS